MKKFSWTIASLLILIFLFASCQNEKSGEDLPQIQEITETAKIIAAIVDPAKFVIATNDEKIESEINITEVEPETTEVEIAMVADKVEENEGTIIKTLVMPVKVLITAKSTEPIVNTQIADDKPKPSIKKFPVLMYHTSSEDNPGIFADLYVKPSEFEKQIKYLSENNYTFCTFNDWYNLKNIEKPVFITFDDGYEENYTEIFPILKKYNAKITIFLFVDPDPMRLTSDMIREMSDSGLVKFESHTLNHVKLTDISSDDQKLIEELRDSKLKIEAMTGKTVIAISYPEGKFNKKVKEKAKEFYNFGLSTGYGLHNTGIDNFEIRRIGVGRNDSINAFIKFLG